MGLGLGGGKNIVNNDVIMMNFIFFKDVIHVSRVALLIKK